MEPAEPYQPLPPRLAPGPSHHREYRPYRSLTGTTMICCSLGALLLAAQIRANAGSDFIGLDSYVALNLMMSSTFAGAALWRHRWGLAVWGTAGSIVVSFVLQLLITRFAWQGGFPSLSYSIDGEILLCACIAAGFGGAAMYGLLARDPAMVWLGILLGIVGLLMVGATDALLEALWPVSLSQWNPPEPTLKLALFGPVMGVWMPLPFVLWPRLFRRP